MYAKLNFLREPRCLPRPIYLKHARYMNERLRTITRSGHRACGARSYTYGLLWPEKPREMAT